MEPFKHSTHFVASVNGQLTQTQQSAPFVKTQTSTHLLADPLKNYGSSRLHQKKKKNQNASLQDKSNTAVSWGRATPDGCQLWSLPAVVKKQVIREV
jgi:hypothetical protein